MAIMVANKIRYFFISIAGIIITGVAFYRLISTLQNKHTVIDVVLDTCVFLFFMVFTFYNIFEKSITKRSRSIKTAKEVLGQEVVISPHPHPWSLGNLLFYTLGCYFVLFLIWYAVSTQNNPFTLLPLTKYVFYFISCFFVVASIYFSFQLVIAIKQIWKK